MFAKGSLVRNIGMLRTVPPECNCPSLDRAQSLALGLLMSVGPHPLPAFELFSPRPAPARLTSARMPSTPPAPELPWPGLGPTASKPVLGAIASRYSTRAVLVCVIAGNLSRCCVVIVGHRGGTGNAKFEPRCEEVPSSASLAWRNGKTSTHRLSSVFCDPGVASTSFCQISPALGC